MPQRYYRNVITVEILSNETWGDEAGNLQAVHYEITDGASMGYITRTIANQEVTRQEAIAADIRMGGDGTFIVQELHMEEEEEENQ